MIKLRQVFGYADKLRQDELGSLGTEREKKMDCGSLFVESDVDYSIFIPRPPTEVHQRSVFIRT